MEWKDVGKIITKAAPVLGTLLGGPAGGTVGAIVSSVLGVENKPDEVHKAVSADPSLLVQLREAEMAQKTELERMLIQSETDRLAQVNETMRAELTSGDKFKSYWRPLFGYIMGVSWGAIMLAVTYQILFNPSNVPDIINAMGQMSFLWGIGLAVLGINVWKRSTDKEMIYKGKQPGALSTFVNRIRGTNPSNN
jgi:hypothetical protein